MFFQPGFAATCPKSVFEDASTDTEQVQRQAEKGHSTIIRFSLQTSYDFYKFSSRVLALSEAKAKKTYGQLLACPHESMNPLQALRLKDRRQALLLRWRRQRCRGFMRFVAQQLARKQVTSGRH